MFCDVQEKISVLMKNLELFEIRVSAGLNLESFLSENELRLEDGVKEKLGAHLASLRQQFCNYLPGMHKDGAAG